MTTLGTIALWLTVLLGTWGGVIAVIGKRLSRPELAESSRRAAGAVPFVLGVALLSFLTALARRDLNVAYISDHVTRNLSSAYVLLSAMAGWNGQAMLSLLVFALFSLASVSRRKANGASVAAVSALVAAGTLAVLLTGDPFRRLGITPVDGRGLDPLLLGPTLYLERPLAILGYGSTGLALVLLVADHGGHRSVPWSRIGWLLLTGSLAVGFWQAYRFAAPDGGFEWGSTRLVQSVMWAISSITIAARAVTDRSRLKNVVRSPGPIAVALGCLCLIIAAVGARSPARESRLKAGASISVPSRFGGSYTLTHMGVSRFQMADRVTAAATMDATRNARSVGLITSDHRQYFGLLGQPIGPPVITVGIHRGMLEDVRVIFREATSSEEALYQIRVLPLVSFIWVGFGLLLLGGIVTSLGFVE